MQVLHFTLVNMKNCLHFHVHFPHGLRRAGLAAGFAMLVGVAPRAYAAPESTRGFEISGPARMVDGATCQSSQPAASVQNNETGKVELMVLVNPDGSVAQTRLKASSGYRDLDRATSAAAARCRFVPKQRNGIAVSGWFTLTEVWDPRTKAGLDSSSECAKPVYPEYALRHEQQGAVNMAFLIGADGTVLEQKVVKSSGFHLLDQAALEAIGQCRFTSAIEGGKPVQAWFNMRYVWSIR